jgi:hypothetical protein
MTPIYKEICCTYPIKYLNNMYHKEIVEKKKEFNFIIVRKDIPLKDGFFRLNFQKILNPFDY